MKATAILIHESDNVVTVIKDLAPGEVAVYYAGDEVNNIATSGVPAYHKIARRDITKGENLIKYGQVMAVATCDIKMGEHVHTQNVKSKVQ